jgi:hypothetical protein
MFSPQNTRTVYINLPECKKRRADVEAQLAYATSVLGPAQRFEAVRHKEGWRGCALSHVGVLRQAVDAYTDKPEVEYLAVFEDDFVWRCNNPERALATLRSVRTPFDVLMLAYPVWVADPRELKRVDTDPHVLCITDRGYWTTAYIVHRDFWATLAVTWAAATKAIDQAWQPLQKLHRFYYAAPVVGNQSAEASTIQTYASRTYGAKLDMDVAVVLLDTVPPGTSLDIARRMFHCVVENVGRRSAVATVRRLQQQWDVVLCIDGDVPFDKVSMALHKAWSRGHRVAVLSPSRTQLDPF